MALPLQPEGRYGLALEEDGEKEADVVDKVEYQGKLQDPAKLIVRPGREDAQVEENDGRAHEEAGNGVYEHQGEK